MTKAAKKRLIESDFYNEVYGVVKAWDYYLHTRDRAEADLMMHRWSMAKLALKHITGNSYGFSRDENGYKVVNEGDSTDVLIEGKSN